MKNKKHADRNLQPQKTTPAKPKVLTRAEKTKRMVLTGILTALVVVLYWIGTVFKIGTVSITLTLIPIVIGAALCGTKSAVWLGLVFGVMVLFDPTTVWFMNMNMGGTFITVLAKGAFCGFAAAYTYKKLEKYDKYVAVVVAGIVCPVVNTAVFLLGCFMFFFQGVAGQANMAGQNVISYMLISFVGLNFLVELLVNIILSSAIVRLINIIFFEKTKKSIYKKNIAVCIVLSIVTLGIYSIFWMYILVKNNRFIQKKTGNCLGEMLCLFFVPFYGLYWWYTRGEQMKNKYGELKQKTSGNGIVYLILSIFGLSIVSMAIMQNDFNSLVLESVAE